MRIYVSLWLGPEEKERLGFEFWSRVEEHVLDENELVFSYEDGIMMDQLKSCDTVLAFWDGEKRIQFSVIMLSLILHKPCSMFYRPLKKWFDINSLEDIDMFVNEHPRWTGDEEYQLVESVFGSGFSKEDKLQYLEYLARKDNYVYELFLLTSELLKCCTDTVQAIREILDYECYPYIGKWIRILREELRGCSMNSNAS